MQVPRLQFGRWVQQLCPVAIHLKSIIELVWNQSYLAWKLSHNSYKSIVFTNSITTSISFGMNHPSPRARHRHFMRWQLAVIDRCVNKRANLRPLYRKKARFSAENHHFQQKSSFFSRKSSFSAENHHFQHNNAPQHVPRLQDSPKINRTSRSSDENLGKINQSQQKINSQINIKSHLHPHHLREENNRDILDWVTPKIIIFNQNNQYFSIKSIFSNTKSV